jgi:short-subunit dehydrogenase involved in D-alanine esterification of teichoic acids
MKLTGNTVLVTGGGSGIGEALAHRLHDLGNTVIVAGRRRDALERAIAGRANMAAMTLDVESAESVAEFARRLLACGWSPSVEDYPRDWRANSPICVTVDSKRPSASA